MAGHLIVEYMWLLAAIRGYWHPTWMDGWGLGAIGGYIGGYWWLWMATGDYIWLLVGCWWQLLLRFCLLGSFSLDVDGEFTTEF